MSKIVNYTIGSDPECFLYSPNKDKYVPAVGLIPGTKDNPHPITDKGHFIQIDNVAAEFNIPACKSEDEFVKEILFVKNHLQKEVLKDTDLILRCIGSAYFNEEDLQSDEAKLFGCEADYNAWTFEQNKIDKSKVNPCLRSAGFHIHLGYDNPDMEVSIAFAQAFDLFVGVPSILLDPDTDRRQLYGKAGAYRFKKFGIECRMLSSFFLETEDLIRWVYQQVIKAINFVNEGGIITNGKEIQECINTSNIELALEIIDDYNMSNPIEELLTKKETEV